MLGKDEVASSNLAISSRGSEHVVSMGSGFFCCPGRQIFDGGYLYRSAKHMIEYKHRRRADKMSNKTRILYTYASNTRSGCTRRSTTRWGMRNYEQKCRLWNHPASCWLRGENGHERKRAKRKPLSHEERLKELYLQQKRLLDTFLEHGAISRAQYDKSLGDLTEKMGMQNADT